MDFQTLWSLLSPKTTNCQARGWSGQVRQLYKYNQRVIIVFPSSLLPRAILETEDEDRRHLVLSSPSWSSLDSHLEFLHVQESRLDTRESPGGGDHLNLHAGLLVGPGVTDWDCGKSPLSRHNSPASRQNSAALQQS